MGFAWRSLHEYDLWKCTPADTYSTSFDPRLCFLIVFVFFFSCSFRHSIEGTTLRCNPRVFPNQLSMWTPCGSLLTQWFEECAMVWVSSQRSKELRLLNLTAADISCHQNKWAGRHCHDFAWNQLVVRVPAKSRSRGGDVVVYVKDKKKTTELAHSF